MKIRRANKDDARRISYLIRTNTQKVIENQYSEEQIRIWKKVNSPKNIELSIASRITFCAFKNNRLIGTIGLLENEVVGLYVSHGQRGKGIGGKLLAHLESYAKKHSLKQLYLTSTVSACEFYKSKGYKVLKPVIVTIRGIGFNETKMMKKLV